MDKPGTVVGRDHEWRLLQDFLRPHGDGLELGIVSGRRRAGKTYLLDTLCRATGGLYHACVRDEGDLAARERFAATIAAHTGFETPRSDPGSWEALLRTALNVASRLSTSSTPLVVIDEFPYAMAGAPELPGLVQLLYDQSTRGEAPPGRLILCGSSLSVMRELLSGTKALRGRAAVDLRVQAFDFRTAAALWDITDWATALRVHACVGGFPGYRRLIHATPSDVVEFDDWVVDTLLNIGRGVFTHTEVDYLLREDPRINDLSGYYDVLGAVAGGAVSLSKIGAAVGRTKDSVRHLVTVLRSGGYLSEIPDLLRGKTTIGVTDPIIRFDRLVTAPHLGQLETGRAETVWRSAAPTFQSRVLGPHFESVAREWVTRFAPNELDRPEGFGDVGCANVHDHRGRAKHEIDVIAKQGKNVTFLGEAKASIHQRGVPDLRRLEELRPVFTELGYSTDDVTYGLFSLNGFTPDLVAAARGRGDVALVDLDRLYGA